MFYRFLHLVFGYVRIEVDAEEIAPILNGLIANGVHFWDLKKLSDDRHSFCIGLEKQKRARVVLEEFKRLGGIGFSSEEKGLFCHLLRYRARVGMIAGVVVGFFFLFLSTFFVWGVTIDTNTVQFSQEELYRFLASCGVREGALVSEVTDPALALKFQTMYPQFVFVSFHANGTHLIAELRGRTEPPKIEEDFRTSNLVARCGGIVRSVEVTNGEPMVLKGDVVNEGDLLVSGAITLRAGGYRLVQSRGVIIAETYREFECYVPFLQANDVYSGAEKIHSSLRVLGVDLFAFFSNRAPFESFSVSEEVVPLSFLDSELPISCRRTTYCEVVRTEENISESRARQLCMDQYRTWLSEVLGEQGSLLTQEIEYVPDKNGITLKAELTCLENIAREQTFEFTEIPQKIAPETKGEGTGG